MQESPFIEYLMQKQSCIWQLNKVLTSIERETCPSKFITLLFSYTYGEGNDALHFTKL